MNNKQLKIIAIALLIMFLLFATAMCIIIFTLFLPMDEEAAKRYEHRFDEVYGDIQFKGKVLKVHRILRGGRVCGIMCIKLDYSNIDDFYRFDFYGGQSCFKIKNGIASLPTNSISNDEGYDKRVNATLSAVYIEVNMDNSLQMVFIDSAGNKYSQNLDYSNSNLKEEDLLLCDECE